MAEVSDARAPAMSPVSSCASPRFLQRPRLADEHAGRPVLAERLHKAGDRLIKAVQSQEDEPEIVQRMPFGMSADFACYVASLDIALHGRIQIAETEVDLAEVVERDAAERIGPHRLEQIRRPAHVPQRVLPRPVQVEVRLAQRDGGLGLSPRVAVLLPDGERLLKVREGLRVPQPGQREAELVEHPGLTEPGADLRALSAATRCVVTQSAQLLRRLNTGNSAGGSRQAMSCRPAAAAWRVAATTLARSSSYQASACSTLSKSSGGCPPAAGSRGTW